MSLVVFITTNVFYLLKFGCFFKGFCKNWQIITCVKLLKMQRCYFVIF